MIKLLKKLHNAQCGFTLIEVIIAVAITGVLIAGTALIVTLTLKGNDISSRGMQAIQQVENAGHWISRDALMAQDIELGVSSGFPFILGWQNLDGDSSQITYSIVDNNLKRDYFNGTTTQTTIIARNIDTAQTSITYSNPVITFNVASTIGSSTENRTYHVESRPNKP